MKLLTKQIEQALPKLYSTENIKFQDKKVCVKFFTPWSYWTWYAIEGERQENGDVLFFGYVQGQVGEWGYFMLSELETIKGPVGLRIERDLHFTPKTLSQAGVTL